MRFTYLFMFALLWSCTHTSAQSLTVSYLAHSSAAQYHQYPPVTDIGAPIPALHPSSTRSRDSIYSYTRCGHRKSTVTTLITGTGLFASGVGLCAYGARQRYGSTYFLGGLAFATSGVITILTGGVIYIVEQFNTPPHTPAIYRYDRRRLVRKRNTALVMSIIGGTAAAIYTADAISHKKLPGQGRIIGISLGTTLSVTEALRYGRFRHQLHSAKANHRP